VPDDLAWIREEPQCGGSTEISENEYRKKNSKIRSSKSETNPKAKPQVIQMRIPLYPGVGISDFPVSLSLVSQRRAALVLGEFGRIR
jgi:hypothetical protein